MGVSINLTPRSLQKRAEVSVADVAQMKEILAALGELLRGAAKNLGSNAADGAAKSLPGNIDAGPYLLKVRIRLGEALTQASDVHEVRRTLSCHSHARFIASCHTATRHMLLPHNHGDDTKHTTYRPDESVHRNGPQASRALEDGNLGDVLAEAVGDVPVDEVQLTKLVYSIVYRRTLDAVIKRCTRGADRQWLGLLMLRTPMTSKADENQWPLSVETWLGSAASELKRAHEWAVAVARALGESTDAEHRLIRCAAFEAHDHCSRRMSLTVHAYSSRLSPEARALPSSQIRVTLRRANCSPLFPPSLFAIALQAPDARDDRRVARLPGPPQHVARRDQRPHGQGERARAAVAGRDRHRRREGRRAQSREESPQRRRKRHGDEWRLRRVRCAASAEQRGLPRVCYAHGRLVGGAARRRKVALVGARGALGRRARAANPAGEGG